jgi:hypothetical protein
MRAGDIERQRPAVVVIGGDEVGSAIAHALHGAGAAVVLVDDIDPPWTRRGRSYTDAWYVGGATLDRVDACFCALAKSIPAVLARGDMIAATTWSWEGLAPALRPHAIVETRPGCRSIPAASRPPLLGEVLTVGVQTTQVGGWRADVVIADASGTGCAAAARAAAHGPPLVALDAPHPGRFRTRRQIAERVDAGDILGEVGSAIVAAPSSGVLTGPSARGARIASGQRIAEIDPCGDPQRCFGIAADAVAIARRVCAAVGSVARSNVPGARIHPTAGEASRRRPPSLDRCTLERIAACDEIG